ncbi:hypothetical protein [Brevundimonas sp.]|uniref:hypothetical protein n=1 Tax=Brevundimonas sp. TaxID=1871086 RepID=UPI002D401368|nr:hypothetical protein [Brevundimonas sp.]HYC98020.1 hypothetical protein [Brevundimonas sp.]
MKRQILVLSVASALVMTAGAAPAPAASVALQSSEDFYCTDHNTCWPIAFYHEIYSDEAMTNLIGSGSDSCNGGPFVTSPWLPAGYEVKTRMYVCAGNGPYLPPDW